MDGETDTEYLKLSVEDRCQHKLWKARVSGYEEAKKLFENAADDKSPEFTKYLGLIKKFVSDSNAVAQEKGLDAALTFVENAGCAGKTAGDVVSGIVNKCLGAPKAKTRDKGFELILMYVEIEKFEIVQEELVKGLEHKTPKVVVACVHSLTEILRNFGPKVLTLKPIVKLIPKLLEDRDKNVREETKQLTIEVYRWIGAPIKIQLQNLKPLQLTELEGEFEKLAGDKPQQLRFLRSQQDLKARRDEIEHDDDDDDDVEADDGKDEVLDPFELIDPVDILAKLPKDFYDKCEAKKWQDRKEAMETLQQLTSNPKLEAGDYGDVVKVLKKIIIKDSNIMVIGTAGKCLTGLANGLRKKFQTYAPSCIPVILEKFKEKKPIVLLPMRDASDAVYNCTNLEAIMEDILAFLENKNPNIKAETLAFISKIFSKSTPAIITKKILKSFCTVILKTLNDADGIVRDNSAVALGTAMKVVGEKAINPFIQDIDNIKMAKVKECCEKAEVTAPKPVKSTKTKNETASTRPSSSAKSAKATTSSKPVSKSTKPAGTSKAIRGGGAKKKAVGAETNVISTEKELSKEEAEEIVSALLPDGVLSGLSNSNWKERLAAMEKFSTTVDSMDKDEIPVQAFIICLAEKPGFKDTNFQVLNLKFATLTNVASKGAIFSQNSAQCCMNDLVDKIGDTKTGQGALQALSSIAEATSLKFVSSEVLQYAFTQKNPKNQSEAINWFAKSIKEFGFLIDLKPTIAHTKKGLSAINPAIRTACIGLIGVMYMYMGPSLRMFYEDEKAALLQQIDAECEKLNGVTPPAPTRGLKPNSGGDHTEDAVNDDGECARNNEVDLSDLIPRSDFGSKIPSSVISELSDKNWKVRAESLDKLKALLTEAKFITSNLGDLPTALKARLCDSNKNLAIQFINFTENLGTALGPGVKQHARNMLPAILSALGDSKNNVRAAALSCLQTWTEQANFTSLIDGEMLLELLKQENPFLRAELFGWLSDGLPNAKSIPNVELNVLLPALYSCVEDRSVDVRKKAQEAVFPFMIHLGYECMLRATSKLKPGSKQQIIGHLEKVKPDLPVKSVKSSGNVQKVRKVAKESDENATTASSQASKTSPPQSKEGGKRSQSKTRKPETVNKSKKKDEEVEVGPPLPTNNLKDQRMVDEKALKTLKWNFTTPREEFIDQLKDQMTTAGFSRILQANMFHSDFKYHLKAIDTLVDCLDTCQEGSFSNVDLILKWISLRFFDTNPSVLLKNLEYLQQLFLLLSSSGYHLSDSDANSFIPYLIIKAGDPKDAVRKGVKEIFKLFCQVYPSNKLFPFLMQGLASKNARQRTECLDELCNLIETYGMMVCQPSAGSAMKEIAKHISDRDNSVRSGALNCIVQAYFLEKNKIFKLVGHLSDKDMSLLEERIKRASKSRPATAPPTAAQHSSPDIRREAEEVTARPKRSPRDDDKAEVTPDVVAAEEPPAMENLVSDVPKRPPRANRPISCGPFTLDFDQLERMVDGDSVAKNKDGLHAQNYDILSEPIPQLPKIKSRPPSPAQKALTMSSDAASSLDLVISQIASNDIKTSINALSQIDILLNNADKADLMVRRVDQLIVTCTLQYRMIYNKYMSDPLINSDTAIQLYKSLTNSIMSMSQNAPLAKTASADVLRDLIHNLLIVLLDTRLNDTEEGPQLSRAVNILVVKVIETFDSTNVLRALIKLLQECVGSTVSVKLTELVMKCLWKLVRMLPNIINELDLKYILYDLHLFLKNFPFSVWKSRSIDTPLRTVKTILHSLAKLYGNKILGYLTLIEDSGQSEVEMYLHKVLKGGSKHKASVSNNDVNSPDVVADAKNATRRGDAHSSPRKLSKSTHETLAEIFKKIGSKENTKEGLSDLYEFKKRHPEADIEPFLKKSSQFFQSYIERGLNTIEQERNNNTTANSNVKETTVKTERVVNISAEYSSSESATESIKSDMPNPNDYMERLKVLRAKCGLDNSKYDSNVQPPLRPPRSKFSMSHLQMSHDSSEREHMVETEVTTNMNTNVTEIREQQTTESSNRAYVEDIRRRLDAIKQANKT